MCKKYQSFEKSKWEVFPGLKLVAFLFVLSFYLKIISPPSMI
jgi:hypothetical protein